tara:strand:+ start:2014 stop:3432 length:1419 start_codon:yes stop_codon:yes gene_type:complete
MDNYGCAVFIESGTGFGVGITHALRYSFFELYSFEYVDELHEHCKNTIVDDRLSLLRIDTISGLKSVLSDVDVNVPILFWLDAHFPGADLGLNDHDHMADQPSIHMPLEGEIEVIKSLRPKSSDVFIIDDLQVRVGDSGVEIPNPPGFNEKYGMGGIGFIEEAFGGTHNFTRDYRQQGFLILTPKEGAIDMDKVSLDGPRGLADHSVGQLMPKVSAILVTGEDERINLARSTVTSFLRQTYPNFEVIIVSASPTYAVLDDKWDRLKEFRVDPVQYPTIGALRNKAIEEASGEWILTIDDDDHNHLHRIFIQMAVRQPGCCVTLSEQVRIDIERNMLCLLADPSGLPGTVLFPRTRDDGKLNLYDADMIDAGEDREFIERNFGKAKTVVLPTSPDWFPGPCTTIAYYHTRNKSSREEFFGRFASVAHANSVASDIPPDHLEYTRSVMEKAGLATTIRMHSNEDAVEKVEPAGV